MSAIGDKIKGKMKQIEGRLTGDKVRTAQGTTEKTKGDVKAKASRVKMQAKAKGREVKARAKASVNRSRARAAR